MDSTIKPSTLTEHIADWHTGLRIDRTNRTVRNVALTGVMSKNGYRYTEQALRAAAGLYEDKPVFLDHATDKSRPHERSTRDLVGTIVNPRYESGRIRGDIRVLDTDSGRTFLALSESDAPGVGMSHVVLAQRAAADGAVDRIRDVVSVDAVVFPATTKTFRESVDGSQAETSPDPSENVESRRREESAAQASDGSTCPECPSTDCRSPQTATPESEDAGLRDQLQQLLCERDQLLSQLREIREREQATFRANLLERQLQEARLPEYALTAEFWHRLMDADEPTRASLIAERRQLIETASRQAPYSTERSMLQPTADGNHTFIAVIKRSAS